MRSPDRLSRLFASVCASRYSMRRRKAEEIRGRRVISHYDATGSVNPRHLSNASAQDRLKTDRSASVRRDASSSFSPVVSMPSSAFRRRRRWRRQREVGKGSVAMARRASSPNAASLAMSSRSSDGRSLSVGGRLPRMVWPMTSARGRPSVDAACSDQS